MHNLLHEKYYNIHTCKSERYFVQMQFYLQTRSSGVKLLEVHGLSKSLDPNIQPEKQNIRPLKSNKFLQETPCIGQGMRKRKS